MVSTRRTAAGLLNINAGGDFGPMEWFQEMTESVFNSISMDSIKEAMGRYCRDEGIGIFDKTEPLIFRRPTVMLRIQKTHVCLSW